MKKVKTISMRGKRCESCKKGKYTEMSIMDDINHTLTCDKCRHIVDSERYIRTK